MNQEILTFNTEFASQAIDKIPTGYIDKTIAGGRLSSLALENDVNGKNWRH